MDVNIFWDTLCNKFGYRFFTGVPNKELSILFNSLNPNILHFVPAVTESIAVSVAAGAALCGDKVAVLCSSDTFELVNIQINDFIIKNKIPILFISPAIESLNSIKDFKILYCLEDAEIINQKPSIIFLENICTNF